MRYSIETLESTNYGDHAERLRKSHVVVEGETVEDLLTRVFTKLHTPYMHHDLTDEVVIRILAEPDGRPSGQAPMPEAPSF